MSTRIAGFTLAYRRRVVCTINMIPGVGVIGLKPNKMANAITLHLLANEAEGKIQNKSLACLVLFRQVQISINLPIWQKLVKYVSLEMTISSHNEHPLPTTRRATASVLLGALRPPAECFFRHRLGRYRSRDFLRGLAQPRSPTLAAATRI